MSEYKVQFKNDVIEIERPDGWLYRLHGIVQVETQYDWDQVTTTLGVRDLSDRTLESVRVIRDAFPDTILEIQTIR